MTAPDAAGIEAALAEGLAAHETCVSRSGTASEWTFSCGIAVRVSDAAAYADFKRAHLAAALLPVVTQAQAEAWDAAHLSMCADAAHYGSCREHENPHRARADESDGA